MRLSHTSSRETIMTEVKLLVILAPDMSCTNGRVRAPSRGLRLVTAQPGLWASQTALRCKQAVPLHALITRSFPTFRKRQLYRSVVKSGENYPKQVSNKYLTTYIKPPVFPWRNKEYTLPETWRRLVSLTRSSVASEKGGENLCG